MKDQFGIDWDEYRKQKLSYIEYIGRVVQVSLDHPNNPMFNEKLNDFLADIGLACKKAFSNAGVDDETEV